MAESSFTQVTVSPTVASTGFGLYELFPALLTILAAPSTADDEFCPGLLSPAFTLLPLAKFGMLVRTCVATMAPLMMNYANTMAIEIIMIFQTIVTIAEFLVLTLVYLSYVTELPECLFALVDC
jgi:hypothetical protein